MASALRPGWAVDQASANATTAVVTPGEPFALTKLTIAMSAASRLDQERHIPLGGGDSHARAGG